MGEDDPAASKVAGRAALAVVMLVGFYVFALGAVGLLLFGAVRVVLLRPGAGSVQVAALFGLAAFAIVIGLAKALKGETFEPSGLRLTEAEQPELWGLVRDMAARVGTRPPDEIWLVPEVNAAVVEQARWLGMRPGRRYMLVGLPLLTTMNVNQLRAVLGHELGHYSNADTRLGELNYRGKNAVIGTLRELSGGSWVNWIVGKVFLLYAKLFILVSHAVGRRQELAADRAAAAIAGRRAMQSALSELPVLDRAWDFYLEQYVQMGQARGIAPSDVFFSFPHLVAGRREEMDAMRRQPPDDRTSVWDSHPAISERVAALTGAPERGQLHDARPAIQLIASIDRVVYRLEQETIDFGDRERIPWPEYVARSVHADKREHADAFYRALSRVTGRTPESLETVLAASAAGRMDDLVQRLADVNVPDGGLAAALEVAALDVGQVGVRLRWDGPADLVLRDGTPFDVDSLADLILGGGQGVGRAREVLQRLGVDPDRAIGTVPSAGADSARAVAAVAPVKVDGQRSALIITDEGLIATPWKKASRSSHEDQLTALLRSRGSSELVADPQNLWISYEVVVRGELVRKVPLSVKLTLVEQNRTTEHVITATLQMEGPGNSEDTFAEVLGELCARGEGSAESTIGS